MKYIKIFWNEFSFDKEWGKFIWYLEIGADHYIKRQLEVFENSNRIKFDENHWSDAYGSLGNQPVNVEALEVEEILVTDFESEWAVKSLNMD